MERYIRTLEQTDPDRTSTLRMFKEDIHYSFVEYQGSNLEHWSFDHGDQTDEHIAARYLCASAFIVADGDIAKKGDRVQRLSEILAENLCVLPCKEIENLMPAEVVRAVVSPEFSRQGRSVSSVKYGHYARSKNGLGAYLDRRLDRPAFASSTGTLKSKMRFCEKAVSLMTDQAFVWSLTPPIESLCERIFRHIERCQG